MGTTFSKKNSPPYKYIVFFDLDQTLADSISGKSLAKEAYRRGLLSNHNLVSALFNSLLFRLRLRDPLKIIDSMVSWVKGIPENVIDDMCKVVLRDAILPSIYDDARAEIKYHQSQNAKVVILSSALEGICFEIAKELSFDDVICSVLEVRNGTMTGRPVGHICFGPEKAIRLQEYCRENSIAPSEAWYYGDSVSDIPPLSVAGHPRCINPDRQLRRTAVRNNWKILSWKN
jgi:putative phosphoserine phosphatase / 1-acylglycerol-3-phosphate O-acyltransferase